MLLLDSMRHIKVLAIMVLLHDRVINHNWLHHHTHFLEVPVSILGQLAQFVDLLFRDNLDTNHHPCQSATFHQRCQASC